MFRYAGMCDDMQAVSERESSKIKTKQNQKNNLKIR